ncbi:MAG: SpoIIE family protein phosphatase [Bacteroidia bacterium]|jgi:serine phosphatase RsbU (regulator of sigma subunit)|nr:SpoIIE family protein phosphatase [Bacteroidia bacterium]GIV23460.1 MAG: hypothetical protein KatS3mg025_1119 [Bacteroidia bacterium]
MALFGLQTTLKAPFPGVRYEPATGKVLARTEAWDYLSPELQEKALLLPAWDFLHENGHIWAKHIVEETDTTQTFFLLPAEGHYEVIQKLERVEAEARFLREQLHAFVQNVPLPLFVVEASGDLDKARVLFANPLLLELLKLPLKRLYEGLTLRDIFGEAAAPLQLLHQAAQQRKPVQETIERPAERGSYWWILQAFPFQSTNLSGIMVGIVDVTKEKEQERQLAEAYAELQVQSEELRQSQEALYAAYEELHKAKEEAEARRKELEDSLIAAQRYQRTLLFRSRDLFAVWGYDRAAVVARSHTYVGGDFLVVRSGPSHLYVGIGDATGHGSSGALLAVTVQGLLHQALLELASPSELHIALEVAQRALFEVLEVEPGKDLSNDGAEVALVALPLQSPERVYVATAGREVVLLLPDGTLIESQQGRRGLGWSAPGQTPAPFSTEELPYVAGATLFLFSDGVTDQLNAEGKRIGRKRFLEWLKESHTAGPEPRDKTRFLLKHWHDWKGEETPQTDDIVLIALQL